MANAAELTTSYVDQPGSELEKERIRSCLTRYCRAVDRRDFDLLYTTYWPGAIDDHVVFVGPVEEYVPWVKQVLDAMVLTQHNLGHSYFEMHGDIAMVETCFTAFHRVPVDGVDRDIMLGARYVDRMEKRGDEWRIAHRILVQDWMQDAGPSINWGNGALGMKFVHDRGVGRSHGDASVEFMRTLGKSAQG